MEALRAGRRLHEVVLAGGRTRSAELDGIAAAARLAGVTVRWADTGELEALAEGVRHQGVVALAPPYPYVGLQQVACGDLLVVLDGVTDPQNLGSIARSAEAAGAGGLVLPRRRSAHVTAAAEKASAGAFSWLPVALVANVSRALGDLGGVGFWTVGLTAGAQTSLWDSPLLGGRVALVVGAEGAGLSRLVDERVDERLAIPMAGRLASLNAGVAAALVLFEVRRRRLALDREAGGMPQD